MERAARSLRIRVHPDMRALIAVVHAGGALGLLGRRGAGGDRQRQDRDEKHSEEFHERKLAAGKGGGKGKSAYFLLQH